MKTGMKLRKLMNVKETAQMYGASRTTFWRMINEKSFPPELKNADGKKIGWTTEYINEWFSLVEQASLKEEKARLGFKEAA